MIWKLRKTDSELYTSKHYPNLICLEVNWKIILKLVGCTGWKGFNWLKRHWDPAAGSCVGCCKRCRLYALIDCHFSRRRYDLCCLRSAASADGETASSVALPGVYCKQRVKPSGICHIILWKYREPPDILLLCQSRPLRAVNLLTPPTKWPFSPGYWAVEVLWRVWGQVSRGPAWP
jgi:hypothetical protein